MSTASSDPADGGRRVFRPRAVALVLLAVGSEVVLVGVALAFAWSLGAHYTGACVGMATAGRALSGRSALWLMAPFAFAGAALASGAVERTVGHGLLLGAPTVPAATAVAVVAGAFLLTIAYNALRIPTSTIQVLVFSIVGAAYASGLTVAWGAIASLAVVWVLAPLAALALGWGILRLADRRRPPTGALGPAATPRSTLRWGLIAAAAGASFTMGANDVSNATGPLLMTASLGPELAAVFGGAAIAVGALTWGRPILRRVAHEVVELDDRMATTAQLVQVVTVLVPVLFGWFTSLNQALVGGLAGVGAARGRQTVRWKTVRLILVGWLLAPPSGLAIGWALAWGLRATGWLRG